MMDVEIIDNTGKILDEFKDKMSTIMSALGEEGVKHAKEGCPVDTGRLRNSITYATSKYKGQGSYADEDGNIYDDSSASSLPPDGLVVIGTNVEYAQDVELNHPRNSHFLRNGVINHKDEIEALAKKLLK